MICPNCKGEMMEKEDCYICWTCMMKKEKEEKEK
jgi:hypothetical protein